MARALIPKRVAGWQTAFADLSMILFLVAAAAYNPAPPKPPMSETRKTDKRENAPRSAPALGAASAIFRPGLGKSLSAWLAQQNADPRSQLTITAFYRPEGREAAAREAMALAEEAQSFPGDVRIVLEPAQNPAVMASLGYDRSGAPAPPDENGSSAQ